MTTERTKTRLTLAAAVAIAAVAVHLPALRNGFINWDDDVYAYANMHIRTLDWRFLWWAFTDTQISGFWHPVTWVSHALDVALWGLRPAGHHLTSILLHGLNSFLVVLLIADLLTAARPVQGTQGEASLLGERAVLITAGLTGALFGIHPVRVESVAWIAERKDLLFACFSLLGLRAYVRYAAGTDAAAAGAPSPAWRNRQYRIAFGSSLLALASKPMAVTFPAILLILDWYPLRRLRTARDLAALVREKVPFLIASLLVSVLTLATQKAAGALMALEAYPASARIVVAFRSLILYLGTILWPLHLEQFSLAGRDNALGAPGNIAAVVLTVVATGAAVGIASRQRVWLAAWGYYVITLLPVLGLFQAGSQVMADRFLYLPALGPFLLIGLTGTAVWLRAAHGEGAAGRLVRSTAIAAALLLAVGLSALTVRQTALWKDSVEFWTRVIQGHPSSLAFMNRGVAFALAGQRDKALTDLDEAIARDAAGPAASLAYANRGALRREQGALEEALADLNRAVELNPSSADAFGYRGQVYADLGQQEKAIEDFDRAVQLDPSAVQAYLGRGAVFRAAGRYDLALRDSDAAIAVDPGNANAYLARGIAYKMLGRLDAALADYSKTIALDPESAEAYNNRGVAERHLGRHDSAIVDFTRAIELSPSFALAYCNRGIAYRETGDTGLALQDQSQALILAPDLLQAYLERGKLHTEQGDRAAAERDYRSACERGDRNGCIALGDLRRNGS